MTLPTDSAVTWSGGTVAASSIHGMAVDSGRTALEGDAQQQRQVPSGFQANDAEGVERQLEMQHQTAKTQQPPQSGAAPTSGIEFVTGFPPPPYYYREYLGGPESGRPPPPPPQDFWMAFGGTYYKEYSVAPLDSETKMYHEETGEIPSSGCDASSTSRVLGTSETDAVSSDRSAVDGGTMSDWKCGQKKDGEDYTTGTESSGRACSDGSSGKRSDRSAGASTTKVELRDEFRRLYKMYVDQTFATLDSYAHARDDENNQIKRLRRLHKNLLHILLVLRTPGTYQQILERLSKQLQRRKECIDFMKRALIKAQQDLHEAALSTGTSPSPPELKAGEEPSMIV